MPSKSKPLRVGLVGAGIGGLAAAIALSRHGKDAIDITILEAASEIGEIGAGIQMTPNVARLLIRWGVSDIIGDNLVEFDSLNLRNKHGKIVSHIDMKCREWCGYPWWLVHRMHLHDGLAASARLHGVKIIIKARICNINHKGPEVTVKSEAGGSWTFDCLVGSDGLNSIVRKTLFPNIKPRPPTGNAAYRAIVPMEWVKNDPLTRELTERKTMDLWLGAKTGKQHGYIISYPISNGRDFNMVMSHHRNYLVDDVEDVDMDEVKETYKDYDPRIQRVIEMIPHSVRRWPLKLTVCPTWTSPEKNVLLMGDAAHSMTNHMAQGAATSMEDGAFLGVVLGAVAQGKLDLPTAVSMYETERMPLADRKQQVSYINGLIYHLEDDTPEQASRDKALEAETRGDFYVRSPNLYVDPWTWRTVYEYDAEAHALEAISKQKNGEKRDKNTNVTREQANIFLNWFMPDEQEKNATAKL